MRILFISRRALAGLSLLGVVICLVGVLKLLGGSPTVAAWVSAGLQSAEGAPVFLAGSPKNGAVSLLVQLDVECDENQLGQMLHILAANSAKATFFVPGKLAEEQPQLVKSILAGGHQLGCCGYDNTSPAQLSLAENRAALERACALLEEAGGERPTVYLPPQGVTEDDIRRAAAEAGLVFVLGGLDSGDWQEVAPEEIIAAVLAQAEAGSFISLHLRENTLTALDTLLKELAAQDLAFCPVGENLAGLEDNQQSPAGEQAE